MVEVRLTQEYTYGNTSYPANTTFTVDPSTLEELKVKGIVAYIGPTGNPTNSPLHGTTGGGSN